MLLVRDELSIQILQEINEERINNKYSDGTYRPSRNLSRAQMAAFIARAFLSCCKLSNL